MFETLTERLNRAFQHLTGQGRLKEEHIRDSLKEIRKALLEADVALSVVKDFIHAVQTKAIGMEIKPGLSPAQQFVKLVQEELKLLMGDANVGLNFKTSPPAVILVAGLQGSGKTTTVAKLAKWIQEREKKSVMLASTDVYRPAAIDQLKTLASQLQIPFCHIDEGHPDQIATEALNQAKKTSREVLIIDTAGRLHIDEPMMQEIQKLHRILKPIETLFVVDSMTGQDAALTAKAFDEALPLTGIILTKTDGDARGGAALSIRHVTGKPIKFVGVGEKLEALELFHPERMASRILGMGDVLSLIEELEEKVDKEKSEKLAKKLQKGQGFDLNDLRDQIKQMLNMGGLTSLMGKLPGMQAVPQHLKNKVNDKEILQTVAILDSMTPQERHYPNLINASGSRKRRIANGAGATVQHVLRVMKQYDKMQKMTKKLMNKGMLQRMMQGMPGQGQFSGFS